jgi:hypothetical protein
MHLDARARAVAQEGAPRPQTVQLAWTTDVASQGALILKRAPPRARSSQFHSQSKTI